jgi:hypothetical protein
MDDYTSGAKAYWWITALSGFGVLGSLSPRSFRSGGRATQVFLESFARR